MITLDGSEGEGGGQILRTALGLAMATGQAFRIEKVRAGRAKPGLLRQHLTAVLAAKSICGATVEGDAIGSTSLLFQPGAVRPGDYTFAVGSAGSAMLVLQTVLPALVTAEGPSALTLEGGTHNPAAPPADFIEQAFLPLLNRMGPRVHLSLERAGFYPAGGGRAFVMVSPAPALSPIELTQRGRMTRRLAKAVVAGLPGLIAKRELDRVAALLNWSAEELQIRQLPDDWGPGNLLTLAVVWEHLTEVFTGFGAKGVTAEAVAENTIREYRRYLASGAPVGEHLADQLLVPLALAGGGRFRTLPPTPHTATNARVIERFLPVTIAVEHRQKDAMVVIAPR